MGLLVMVKPTQMTHSRRVEWAGSLIPSGMRKLNKESHACCAQMLGRAQLMW